jgi:hypothetical protein
MPRDSRYQPGESFPGLMLLQQPILHLRLSIVEDLETQSHLCRILSAIVI